MKTRAFLVKDIDPEILQRLLGTRSLATELSDKELQNYYLNKAPIPENPQQLLQLMSHGGGLTNPSKIRCTRKNYLISISI